MLAVVTGASGFIGRSLVRGLANRGPVIAIDRLPGPHSPGVTTLNADLLDEDPAVRHALHGADVVFHLAGCPDVRDSRPDADSWRHRDNVLATAAVLAAVPAHVPVLMTSSSSVYGGSRRGRPCAEHHRLRPRGGYASSKVAAERLCRNRLRAGGAVTVVRPFTVAGEGQRPGMALSRWIAAALAGEPLRVLGSPDRTRDITDVRQVVEALLDLAAVAPGGVVNLGTGVGHSLGELIDAVARGVGTTVTVEVQPARRVEVEHTLADTTRLRQLIGWVPHTDLDDLVGRQLSDSRALSLRLADSR
ncbi:MAG: NAD-dependent epimerase/dehydratase family protein [Pseudonocardia sp.]